MPSLRARATARPSSPPPPVPNKRPTPLGPGGLEPLRTQTAPTRPDRPNEPSALLPEQRDTRPPPQQTTLTRSPSPLSDEFVPEAVGPKNRSTTSLRSAFSNSDSDEAGTSAAPSRLGRKVMQALRRGVSRKASGGPGQASAPQASAPRKASAGSSAATPKTTVFATAQLVPPAGPRGLNISAPILEITANVPYPKPLLPLAEAKARMRPRSRPPVPELSSEWREGGRLYPAMAASPSSASVYSTREEDAASFTSLGGTAPFRPQSMSSQRAEEGFPFDQPSPLASLGAAAASLGALCSVNQVEDALAPPRADGTFRAADARMQAELLWSLQFTQLRPRLRRVLLHAACQLLGVSGVRQLAKMAGAPSFAGDALGEEFSRAKAMLQADVSGEATRAAHRIEDELRKRLDSKLGRQQVQHFFSTALELGDASHRRRELGRVPVSHALANEEFCMVLRLLGAAGDEATRSLTQYYQRLHNLI